MVITIEILLSVINSNMALQAAEGYEVNADGKGVHRIGQPDPSLATSPETTTTLQQETTQTEPVPTVEPTTTNQFGLTDAHVQANLSAGGADLSGGTTQPTTSTTSEVKYYRSIATGQLYKQEGTSVSPVTSTPPGVQVNPVGGSDQAFTFANMGLVLNGGTQPTTTQTTTQNTTQPTTTQPANLWEYYQSQGLTLPSIQERAAIYEQLGLGDASSYTGDALQNEALLNSLSQGDALGGQPGADLSAGATFTPDPRFITDPDELQNILDAQQSLQNIERLRDTGFDTSQELAAGVDIEQLAIQREQNITNILSGYGIDGVPTDEEKQYGDPMKYFEDTYKGIIESLGLTGVQASMDSIKAELKEIDDAFAEKVGDINENPWISEALRTKKIESEQAKYEMKRASAVDRIDLF